MVGKRPLSSALPRHSPWIGILLYPLEVFLFPHIGLSESLHSWVLWDELFLRQITRFKMDKRLEQIPPWGGLGCGWNGKMGKGSRLCQKFRPRGTRCPGHPFPSSGNCRAWRQFLSKQPWSCFSSYIDFLNKSQTILSFSAALGSLPNAGCSGFWQPLKASRGSGQVSSLSNLCVLCPTTVAGLDSTHNQAKAWKDGAYQ